MSTMQQLCDTARLTFNDPSKVRFPDSELLTYLNDALTAARRKRPDLFFGNWTGQTFSYQLTDTCPLSEQYRTALEFYVIFRCEAKEDEFEDSGRAEKFLAQFYSMLGAE